MLKYDRINISEGIDINKRNTSKKNMILVIIGTLKILDLSMNLIFAMIAVV